MADKKTVTLSSSRSYTDIGTVGQTTAALSSNVQSINDAINVGYRNTNDLGNSFLRVNEFVALGFATLNGRVLVAADFGGGGLSTVNVEYSIAGDGSVGTPLRLVGDTATPGANKVYGTDGSGNRGWQTAGGGGSSPLTTKGDIYTYTTVDARLGVGSNGQLLSADSTQSSGLKWIAAPSSGPTLVGANIDPNTHPQFPTPRDDEFEEGALDPKWTWVNQSSAVGVVFYGQFRLKPSNSASINHNSIVQPVVGATWGYTTRVSIGGMTGSQEAGMIVRNSANNHFLTLSIYPSGGPMLLIQGFTDPNTYGGTTYLNSGFPLAPLGGECPYVYLQITYDGTTIFFNYSLSGEAGTFVNVFTQTPGTFLGGVDSIGLSANSGTTSPTLVAAFDWFRENSSSPAGGVGLPTVYLNANVNPDTHPQTPTAQDDEFEGSSLSGQWTWVQQNTATAAFNNGAIVMTGEVNAANVINMIVEPLPAGSSWKFRAKFSTVGTTNNFEGLTVYEAATGQVASFGIFNPSGPAVIVATGTVSAGYTAVPTGVIAMTTYWPDWVPNNGMESGAGYWEIERIGSTLFYRISKTGIEGSFFQVFSHSLSAAGFTTAPDHVGLHVRANNGAFGGILLCDWIRNYSSAYTPKVGTIPALAPFNIDVDTHSNTPSTLWNDEFEGPSLDTGGIRFAGAIPWTWQNQSPAVATLGQGALSLTQTPDGSLQFHVVTQPLPTGPWKFRTKQSVMIANGTNYAGGGILLQESGSGKFADFHKIYSGGQNGEVDIWPGTFASPGAGATASTWNPWGGNQAIFGSPVYLEIEFDGTTYYYRWSITGYEGSFVTVTTTTNSIFGGTNADHIGLGGLNTSTGPSTLVYDWWRRML